MKIVIVSDSFKGCASSREINDLIEEGVRRAIPDAEVVKIPVADGGEGTVDA
ncbi:MAG: glycerate kinase, partial [Bacteroidales bacterium]|nr:glycerate kinase [Bacteroidales bacterium]